MTRFDQLIRAKTAVFCAISERQASILAQHYEFLVRWNKVLNLTSVCEMEEAVTRHYAESLFLASHLPKDVRTVVDLGSGAGFPGIPIAVMLPQCRVTLVESHKRKAVFLREVSRSLPGVRVVAERAEKVGEKFEWLVSRAVSATDVQRNVPALAPNLGLLLAREDADKLLKEGRLDYDQPVPMPWNERNVVLLGHHVPRETC